LVWEGFGGGLRAIDFRAEGLNAVEILDGAAVESLGLGRIAQAQGQGVGLGGAVLKSSGQQEVTFLCQREFGVDEESRPYLDKGRIGESETLVETGGQEAGFQAGDAEHGVLGEGDALDGEEFLGIGGLVELDEVGAKVGDVIGVLDTEDGVRGGGEAVFAGVLSGTGFAIGGARAGGIGGVGAIGCELFGGNVILGVRHGIL
jgi:hypothetical protein